VAVERARSRQRAAEARARDERARLINKILTATERQRSAMAAELLDGPIQSLTRLGLSLERGQLRLRRGQLEEGGRLFADAREALRKEVQALRRIMATLRPPVLEERGLVSALSDYVEVVRQQAGITCTLAARLPARLPGDQEIVPLPGRPGGPDQPGQARAGLEGPGRADRDRRRGAAGGARRAGRRDLDGLVPARSLARS
jgi:signal transduction histidine kinase